MGYFAPTDDDIDVAKRFNKSFIYLMALNMAIGML